MATNLEGLDKGLIKKTAHFIYDVPKDGGAATTYTLGDKEVPPYAVVTSTKIYVETAFVGGTSVSFGLLTAADISAAIATATLVLNYAVVGTEVDATGTTWLLTGATGRQLICVVVGTFTAGRVHVWADYFTIK